eukprot:TRINITY_DN7681_c0_g1_i1.p1 TRINITY_DN7681_c0_g1~~TRINITY_DN7681_c0_g1_i1.p1  ORF type:complete len:331 (+),score=72.48 TRINITY_DN7681_c0_g1_i1:1242-2234(+)
MGFVFFAEPDPIQPVLAAVSWLGIFGAGISIGIAGVGGVFVVPFLLLANVEVKLALTSTVTSFIPVAMSGTWAYSRQKHVPWAHVGWASISTMTTAVAASFAVQGLPDLAVLLLIVAFTLTAGLYSLYTIRAAAGAEPAAPEQPAAAGSEPAAPEQPAGKAADPGVDEPAKMEGDADPDTVQVELAAQGAEEPPTVPLWLNRNDRLQLLGAGSMIGAGSVLSGTGGPLLTVVTMSFTKLQYSLEPIMIIGMCQAISIPFTIFATLGFYIAGLDIDMGLVLVLAVTMSCSIWIGAHLAHLIEPMKLKMGVAVLLICIGVGMVVRTTIQELV